MCVCELLVVVLESQSLVAKGWVEIVTLPGSLVHIVPIMALV